jgi:hypothetical protein
MIEIYSKLPIIKQIAITKIQAYYLDGETLQPFEQIQFIGKKIPKTRCLAIARSLFGYKPVIRQALDVSYETGMITISLKDLDLVYHSALRFPNRVS